MQNPFYTQGGKFDFVCDMAMPKGINVFGYILNIFIIWGKIRLCIWHDIAKGRLNVLGYLNLMNKYVHYWGSS
jgi:hypothetical protein